MERVNSGVKGLDELLKGGIPRGSVVLVSGGSGTGKTIFAMQFIYNGALEYKEPGLFVTIESHVKNITWNMESFNWDIKKLQDKKLMNIYKLKLGFTSDEKEIESRISGELDVIAQMVKEIGAKRIVIDSTTAFGVWFRDQGLLRNMLYKFTDGLKDLDCTTILTAETKAEKMSFSAFGVEEFISDGLIILYFIPPHRTLYVRKMRGIEHSMNVHPFDITKNGIVIKPKETVLWEAIK